MKFILKIIIVLFIALIPLSSFAAITGISFGGRSFSYAPCTCSGGSVYYLTIGPPTKGVLVLAYVLGSQGFLNYALPFQRQIKGLYNPAITTACWMYAGNSCVTYPTQGLITYMVGSSI